jgi:hypothetical protein
MKPTAFQVHRSGLVPAVLLLVVTVVVGGVVVCFAQRLLLWAALIPGTLPLSLWFVVALPLLREEKRKSRTDVLGPK